MVKFNVLSSSGTFDTVASAAQVNGTAVKINREYNDMANLSAIVTVLAETDTFTIAPKWEVSDDNSTFRRATPPNNAADVVIATGTAGADTSVSCVLTAPDGVFAWQYARLALVAGGTTGTSSDTYSIGYCFRSVSNASEF